MSSFDYYNFQEKTARGKISEEINFYENCIYKDDTPVKDYIDYLKSRIGINSKQESLKIIRYDNSGNKREIKKMNLDEYSKDMDVFVFKKPWNKLREFHKTMKIKEFIKGLKYKKKVKPELIEKNKSYLYHEIVNGIKEKKFGKNKTEVIYDQDSMIIVSISCIYPNKKTNLYAIDWDS